MTRKTDPVADMLTRLRNANSAYHEDVSMPFSKLKSNIAEILKTEGYITGWSVEDAEVGKTLFLDLKFGPNRNVPSPDCVCASKPAWRVYAKSTNLPKVLGGLGIAILSTSSGLLQTARPPRRVWVGKSSPTSGKEGEKNMSRIGKNPISVPSGVEVKVDGQDVAVKGPKGELSVTIAEPITVSLEDGVVTVARPDEERESRSLHGLSRTLINNLIVGVTEGYSKGLEIRRNRLPCAGQGIEPRVRPRLQPSHRRRAA